jgi:branched-subunit amino acid aminotransferase/4-amino-4-deoxychorismate lyase
MSNPLDEVFTTVKVLDGKACMLDLHLARLREHAQIIGLEMPELDLPLGKDGLLRITIGKTVDFQLREAPELHRDLRAISCPAPRWHDNLTGVKHGDWLPYTQARNLAEEAGADIALLIYQFHIVDGDRAMPIVLDEDGGVWISPPEFGGVASITFQAVCSAITAAGIPIRQGRLNERIVARCHEMVMLGTGVGVARLLSIDGESVGNNSTLLSDICRRALTEAMAA